jgi:hypothetical protein
MKAAIAFGCLLSFAVPCFAETILVDSRNNCRDFVDGLTISLPQGTYQVEWVSGALSPFPDDTYQAGYVWQSQLRLYVYSTAQSGLIGAPSWYTSFELAEAAAKGTYILVIPSNTVVSFYFYEGYDVENCTNNRGEVVLDINLQLATHNATWGRIKALYRR